MSVDGNYQGTINTTPPSDERLKINVQEDVPGLDAVLNLRPITFEYDKAKRKLAVPGRQYGLIAQEAQPHVPLVVQDDGMEEEHYLAIDYRLLVPVLIQAIKDLTARVVTLEAA